MPPDIINAFDPLSIEGPTTRAPPFLIFGYLTFQRYLTILLPMTAFLLSIFSAHLIFSTKSRHHCDEANSSFLPQYLTEKLRNPCPSRSFNNSTTYPQTARTLWKISRLAFLVMLALHLICIQREPSKKPVYYTRSPKQYDGSGGVTMITVELLQGKCWDWVGYAALALFCGLVDPGSAGH